ncbi:hypothetical protein PHYBLDRAFT_138395 [Phycomyces blakesleeanus NRRL 1555(-)]|uniref:Homeodomain-like DNA binding domain-containing transcription factor n=1 Tax=Phycomyces blakesleeanus (strain ATCC 8743b / DSM 1359 / FGSC 10004 / NBRC 33097 / NRRL 1555) TaxID=763407 RepID=A0A167R4T0_PHYB8|nr:hypothetical protein PHYBLDRAFT_138395 [Phycomyces blakesleeanus NRRL 1555(-)]OAD80844.1 hypothetical protein PHYBLDRAFT_138395 [Phycomyces blakesleeanus NRRL 1555(-)]|eukprot:XP_018298884.1 hypothetical protein PHYBLDRAFT_138395 [Phycomyces blakesleeanus NRRL 1555(-)]
MPSNSSRKTDRKGKGKASASISTSANRVLAGRVGPREIALSFSSTTIQDQRYAEIVEMFNKVNNNINGVKDDIAAVNSNMAAFKNRMGIVVDTSGKTHMAFADFATVYANNQTCMASLGPSLMPSYVPQTSLSDAEISDIILEIFAEKLWDWKFESDDPALVAENESKKKWNLNEKINHRDNVAVINYLKSYISAQTRLAGTHPWVISDKIKNRYKHSHCTFHESPEQKAKKNSKGRANSSTLQMSIRRKSTYMDNWVAIDAAMGYKTGNPVEKAYLKLFQKDAMSDGESDIEIVDNLPRRCLHVAHPTWRSEEFNRLLTMVDDIDRTHHVLNVGVGTKSRMNRYPATLLPCSVPATLSQSLPHWAINDE